MPPGECRKVEPRPRGPERRKRRSLISLFFFLFVPSSALVLDGDDGGRGVGNGRAERGAELLRFFGCRERVFFLVEFSLKLDSSSLFFFSFSFFYCYFVAFSLSPLSTPSLSAWQEGKQSATKQSGGQ